MNNKHELLNQIVGTLLKSGTKLSLNNLRYLARIKDDELITLLEKKDLEPITILENLSSIPIAAQPGYRRKQLWDRRFFHGHEMSEFCDTVPRQIVATDESSAFCSQINIPLIVDELFSILGGVDNLVHSTFSLAQAMAIAQKNTVRTPPDKRTMDFKRSNYFLISGAKNQLVLLCMYSKEEARQHKKWGAYFVKEGWQVYRGSLFLKNN